MQTLFLNVLDMSIVASVVILIVLAVRFCLTRAPKAYSYVLWGVVLFRLLCPFTVESVLSLIPERIQDIPQEMALETAEHVSAWNAMDAAQRAIGDALNGGIGSIWVRLESERWGNQGISMATHKQVWLLVMGFLWPVGMGVMLVYSVVGCIKLRKKLVGVTVLGDATSPESKEGIKSIYLSDYIASPFVMGIIHPCIFLPSTLTESEREYIILHERYHIRRGDHVIKLLTFLALCIHWFNPLVWVAYNQATGDMEMSCDEAVIREKGEQVRAEYAASLLKLSMGKRVYVGMPPAFGEGDIKGRIRNLAKWKKPKLWVCLAAMVVCVVFGVVCVVNPQTTQLSVEELGEGVLVKAVPHVEKEIVPGTTYVSYSCIYMNLLSSSFGEDTGYRYLVEEDSFTAIHKRSGNKTSYDSVKWEWQAFPWTDEQWSEMFIPSSVSEISISEIYEEMLYIKLSESDCLLRMDGQLWLVDIHENNKMGKHIWSIYALVPEEIQE